MSLNKNGRAPSAFILSLLFLFVFFIAFSIAFSGPASARAERQTFVFSKGRDQDLKKLSELCFFNDLTSADVLWANDLTADCLTEGTTLIIPASKQDILAVWQRVQKGKKDTNAPLVSVKLHGVPQYARQETPAPVPASRAPSPSPSPAPSPVPETAPQRLPQKTAFPPQPLPPNKDKATAADKKPDLAESAEKKAELKEPALFLEPEGSPVSGPMRLLISGDSISVVRLPRPKEPRMPHLDSFARAPLAPPAPGFSSGLTDPRTFRGTGAKMIWPVNGAVSSGYGKRGKRSFHSGLDIPMPKGTPIRAAKDGVVKQVVSAKSRGFRGYGNVVLLDHGGGISTLYSHCLELKVRQGQRVRQGEIIATVGRTGRASTNHVHFEVRVKGRPVDPMPYLVPRSSSNRR